MIVDIRNRDGSVEHYYHFLLGFCVPLVRFSLSCGTHAGTLVVRECGPLTPLLAELRLDLHILPVAQFRTQAPGIRVGGYDFHRCYDHDVFAQFAGYVGNLHAAHRTRQDEKCSVILIERGPPAEFYLSQMAEVKGSGSSRCAIKNHRELAAALGTRLPSFKNVRLEGRSLLEQFEIFRNADVVIAQHGASLANLIFAREGSSVIEIGPRRHGGLQFSTLAKTMRLKYSCVARDTLFPEVDPDEILALCNSAPDSRF